MSEGTIVEAACKHCGLRRNWVEGKAGELSPMATTAKPAESISPALAHMVKSEPYGCLMSPTGTCEAQILTRGDRMVSDIAKGISKRLMGRGMRKLKPRP